MEKEKTKVKFLLNGKEHIGEVIGDPKLGFSKQSFGLVKVKYGENETIHLLKKDLKFV